MRGWLKALQPTGPDEAACPHPGLSPMVPVSPTAGFRQRPRVNGTGHLALAGASPTTWSWKPVAVASGAHLSPPTWRKARTERKEPLAGTGSCGHHPGHFIKTLAAAHSSAPSGCQAPRQDRTSRFNSHDHLGARQPLTARGRGGSIPKPRLPGCSLRTWF